MHDIDQISRQIKSIRHHSNHMFEATIDVVPHSGANFDIVFDKDQRNGPFNKDLFCTSDEYRDTPNSLSSTNPARVGHLCVHCKRPAF